MSSNETRDLERWGSGELVSFFDDGGARNFLSYAVDSIRRRWRLALAVWFLVVVSVCVGAWALPKSYSADVRMLAVANPLMPSLATPRRAMPYHLDEPTRAVSEIVLSRENLERIIERTELEDQWLEHEAPLPRLIARGASALFGDPPRSVFRENLVETLRDELSVTEAHGAVTFAAKWSSAEMAYRLARALMDTFLEIRRVQDVQAIADTLRVIETHERQLEGVVQATLKRVKSLAPTNPGRRTRAVDFEAFGAADRGVAKQIDSTRREIQSIQRVRAERATEIRKQLMQLTTDYTARHPLVLQLERSLEELSRDPDELITLKMKARTLASTQASGVRRLGVLQTQGSEVTPEYELASQELEIAVGQFADLVERRTNARIELDTAEAAFDYRYTVLSPAKRPEQPVSPRLSKVILASIAAGLVLGLVMAVGLDVLSRRIYQRWQIERVLGLEVIEEIEVRS
ncbi:MAG: hypothetical protein HY791_17790 [Deltaproteobacteria bacterium]|nr:hypothetical protein [Deltaproteobacteria bacterium]